jgi:hypothetical protein
MRIRVCVRVCVCVCVCVCVFVCASKLLLTIDLSALIASTTNQIKQITLVGSFHYHSHCNSIRKHSSFFILYASKYYIIIIIMLSEF